MRLPDSFALASAAATCWRGLRMIAITTSSSIKVKAFWPVLVFHFSLHALSMRLLVHEAPCAVASGLEEPNLQRQPCCIDLQRDVAAVLCVAFPPTLSTAANFRIFLTGVVREMTRTRSCDFETRP